MTVYKTWFYKPQETRLSYSQKKGELKPFKHMSDIYTAVEPLHLHVLVAVLN